MAGVTVGACGDSTQGATRPAAQEPMLGHDPEVRDAMRGLFAGENVRLAAVEELVRRCMTARGLRYVKNPMGTKDVNPTLIPDPYGVPLEEAGRFGYRTADNLRDAPRQVDRSGVLKLSQADQARWGNAYWGRDSAPQIRVKVPGGGIVTTNSEGCLSEARKTLFGSLERWLKLSNFAGGFAINARRRSAADPAMNELNKAWSACMSGKGHAALSSPDHARTRAGEFHRRHGVGSDKALDEEKALATADAECENQVDYAPRRRELEDRHYRDALRAHEAEITAVLEMNEEALTRAHKILQTG